MSRDNIIHFPARNPSARAQGNAPRRDNSSLAVDTGASAGPLAHGGPARTFIDGERAARGELPEGPSTSQLMRAAAKALVEDDADRADTFLSVIDGRLRRRQRDEFPGDAA